MCPGLFQTRSRAQFHSARSAALRRPGASALRVGRPPAPSSSSSRPPDIVNDAGNTFCFTWYSRTTPGTSLNVPPFIGKTGHSLRVPSQISFREPLHRSDGIVGGGLELRTPLAPHDPAHGSSYKGYTNLSTSSSPIFSRLLLMILLGISAMVWVRSTLTSAVSNQSRRKHPSDPA